MEFIVDELILRWKDQRELVKRALKREVAQQLLLGRSPDADPLRGLLAAAEIMLLPTVVVVLRVKQTEPPDLADPCGTVFVRLEDMLRGGQEAISTIMGQGNILATMAGDEEIAVLLPLAEVSRHDDPVVEARRYARYIKAYLERDGVYHLAVGIGSTCLDSRALRESYDEARMALDYTFYEICGPILHIAEVRRLLLQPYRPDFIGYETVMTESLRKGDWEDFSQAGRRLLAEIVQARTVPPSILRVRILELLTLLTRALIDRGANPARLLDFKVKLGTEIDAIRSARELKSWLEAVFERLIGFARIYQGDLTAKAVADVKQYLYANYARNISLEELAQLALLSPHYLSRMFSEASGMSITEYLKQVRVRKAQHLLRNSTRSVTEVAAAVGYSDPNYFARVFKNLTGQTPHQFRKGGDG